ncbi:hypothetical protein MC885_014367, partial [Smutsia gigantea]
MLAHKRTMALKPQTRAQKACFWGARPSPGGGSECFQGWRAACLARHRVGPGAGIPGPASWHPRPAPPTGPRRPPGEEEAGQPSPPPTHLLIGTLPEDAQDKDGGHWRGQGAGHRLHVDKELPTAGALQDRDPGHTHADEHHDDQPAGRHPAARSSRPFRPPSPPPPSLMLDLHLSLLPQLQPSPWPLVHPSRPHAASPTLLQTLLWLPAACGFNPP